MNSTLTRALCSLVVCLTCGVAPCLAQSGPPGGDAAGRAAVSTPDNDNVGYAVGSPFGPQIGFGAQIGDGIGWEDSYYSANALVPLHFDPGVSMIFGMINLSVTGNGDGVVNLGSGYRYRHQGLNRIFGFYGFADIDDGYSQAYKRVGVGVESLGKYFDMRANAYRVLGDSSQTTSDVYTGTPFFLGNFLVLNRRQAQEEAYSGADLEVGGLLPYIGRYGLSAHVGPYYLYRSDSKVDDSTLGVKARVAAQINEDLTISGNFSNDDIFGSNAHLQISMTLPDGRPTRWFRPTPVKERMAQAPVREWRIPVHRFTTNTPDPLINPADNQPFLFAHIFPNNTATGNGTIENPFNSTANFVNAPRYDVIYVRPGNQLNLDNGFVLFDNQRLLSTAVTHQIVATQGTFNIPGFTGGVLPVITNPNTVAPLTNPVIQIANNNEVSGFTIDGSNGVNPILDGIRSQPGGLVGGFNINRNQFVNNRDSTVISVVGGNSYGAFVDNILTGAGAASDRGFSVDVQNAGTNLNLFIARNTATNYQGLNEDQNNTGFLEGLEDRNGNGRLDFGTAFGVTARNGGTISATNPTAAVNPTGIVNNAESASGTGLQINGINAGLVNAVVNNNAFTSNVSLNTGLSVVANNGTVNLLSVDSNNLSQNLGNGVSLFVRNNGLITGNFTSNLISENGLNQVLIDGNDLTFADNGQVLIQTFSGNNLSRTTTGQAGILINTINTDVTLANVLGNNISAEAGAANRSFGIGGTMEGGSLNLFVGDGTVANLNNIDGNGDAGIGFNFRGNVVVDARILGNLITNSVAGAVAGFAGEGINYQFTDTATFVNPTPLNLLLDPNPDLTNVVRSIHLNTITGNANHGINLSAGLAAVIDSMVISNNLIDNNGNNGINPIRANTARITNFVVADNNLTNNGVDGFWTTNGGLGTQDSYVLARNNISNNTFDGVHVDLIADAQLLLHMFNNNISDNGLFGVFTSQTTNTGESPDLTGLWLGNVIARNANNGILLDVNHGTFAPLEIGRLGVDANGFSQGNMITDNGLAGILISGTGNSTIVNNVIARNGDQLASVNEGAGIDIEATLPGTPTNNVTINNNQILDNFGDGVEILATSPAGNSNLLPDTTVVVNMANNRVDRNQGRGLDVLNSGDALTTMVIDNNTFNGNLLEGTYFVLTAATAQLQNNAATAAMLSSAVTADTEQRGSAPVLLPVTRDAEGQLAFTFTNNRVIGNGVNSAFSGTGMVVRVGTIDSNGPNFATDAGGSGVAARMENNIFNANSGSDVHFESFVSTNFVADTQLDPLSRFDLRFLNNTVGTLDVLANPTAFYSNASTVKSSSFNNLFVNGRRRNATRIVEDITNIAGSQTVAGGATTIALTAAPVIPGGPIASASTNASEFVARFTVGPPAGNIGVSRTITTYNAGAYTFTDANGSPFSGGFPLAPGAGSQFQIDYLRVAGIGDSSWRVQQAGNTIGTTITGFGTQVILGGLNGEENFRWDATALAPGLFP